MRAHCPHCGALNEFSRPPSTAIVYCRVCRKPFGSAAVHGGGAKRPMRTPLPRTAAGSSPAVGPSPGRSARSPAEPIAESTHPPAGRRAGLGMAAPFVIPRGRETGGPVAKIVYRSPDGLETDFELDDQNHVGRHPKNNIRLNDREISKEHAVLERRDTEWWLQDLDSSNGTFVNGRRIRETRLTDGDELLLGSMKLIFQLRSPGPGGASAKDLVTILPQDPGGSTHIHAKIREEMHEFLPASDVQDVEVLKRDYEKLRMSHELSRVGLLTDVAALLSKTMDVVFSMFPADNAVVLLVDSETGRIAPHTVRQRAGQAKQEILLSSTIVNGSLQERASVLSSDAFLDPRFSGSQSIIAQGIRAAMCVPMIAHDKVLGVMHVDSRERVGAFTEKDLQLLTAIANQTAIAIENARLVRQIEQEARTRGQLQRFLPPHVVDEMVQGKGKPIQKGGREVEASVVFCDIRGFTHMSESSGPQEVVDLLNEYFERLVEVVFDRGGVLDKFIGDSLMASWGTMEGDNLETSALDCVYAAIEFRDAIRELNQERMHLGLVPIRMGVGVNTGRLVAGYMGSRRRLEFTVVGDTVNTASRICGIAAGDQVLVSEATQRYVADRIELRYLGMRQVKGREQEVEVYEAVRILDGVTRSASGS